MKIESVMMQQTAEFTTPRATYKFIISTMPNGSVEITQNSVLIQRHGNVADSRLRFAELVSSIILADNDIF